MEFFSRPFTDLAWYLSLTLLSSIALCFLLAMYREMDLEGDALRIAGVSFFWKCKKSNMFKRISFRCQVGFFSWWPKPTTLVP